MLNIDLKTETKSGKTHKRKEERLLCFSERHSMALIAALGNAGVSGLQAEAVVEQLKRLAESGIPMMSDKNRQRFAISRANWARQLIDRFDDLSEELGEWNDRSEGYFHLEVGHSLSASHQKNRSALRKEGLRAVQGIADVADHILSGAQAVFTEAVDQVFEGGSDSDRSLREFCGAVRDCWKAATSRPLPKVDRTFWCFQCWEHLKARAPNPLWIVLDSLGINVGESAVNCLVAYVNGEPVDSVKYDF